MTSTDVDEHLFTVVRRGYDRDEVDARMAGMQRQVEALEGELTDVRSTAADLRRAADGFRIRLVELESESEAMHAQLERRPDPAVAEALERERRDLEQAKLAAEQRAAELAREVEDLTARLQQAEAAPPAESSYETLGNEVASVLRSAQDQATAIRAAAEDERGKAEAAVAEAEARAARLAASAERQAQTLIDDAHGKAVTIVAEARAEAERLRAEAADRVAALQGERKDVLASLGRLVGGIDDLVASVG